MGLELRLQKSAEHHKHHDNEEAKCKKGMLRSPKGEEHDLDSSSKIPLSHFAGRIGKAHSQEKSVVVSERSEHSE